MRTALREVLATGRVLLCDGAIGTMLQASGLEAGQAPEMMNLRQPERVLAVHLGYVAAGADIITTNTFGGNRLKLARAGLRHELVAANRAGVEVAREAASGCAYVGGSMGPTGDMLEPFGELSEAEAVEVFAEQAKVLAESGVDLFLIETMTDLVEAKAAIAGIRQVSDLPIFCSLTFDTGGRTIMGVRPSQAADALAELGVDAFGANCGQGPEGMEGVVREMLAAQPQAVVIAQPNAGLPELEGERTVYRATPENMAEYGRRFADLGVRVVGACCGSTPAHTAAIAKALEGLR